MANNFWWTPLVAIIISLSACGGSFTYSSDPIDAVVVDADTGQPIEGAIVTANWQLESATLDNYKKVGQLKVMETVTDNTGHFHFDGFTAFNPGLYELREEDPKILVFKPGYRFYLYRDHYRLDLRDLPAHRNSAINGKVIQLKPFKGEVKEYAENLSFLHTELAFVYRETCGWQRTPRMVAAQLQQKRVFREQSVFNVLLPAESYGLDSCGSVPDVLKEFAK